MRRFCNAPFGAARLLSAGFFFMLTTSVPVTALADEGVIAGFFRGSEMKTTGIGEICFDDPGATFVFDVVTGVTASVSGTYHFSNTGHHYDIGSQIAVYSSFDPADPSAARLGWTTFDTQEAGGVQLEAGTEYTIVVQSFECGGAAPERGEWSFIYRGPGLLSGPSIYALPAYASGTLNSSSPTFVSPACGNTRYALAGPIQVPVTGQYRYSDASVHFAVDVEVYVYEGGFDANSPETNLVRVVDDGYEGPVRLEEGVDYYFVTAPWGCEVRTGNYQYVLMGPSGEFVTTEGVNGAWVNVSTLGQGLLMDVYPDINLLFAAWFTWDTTPADAGAAAEIGDPNQRWLTAQGGFEGDTATLVVYLSRGGLFDDPAPVENEPAGTMTIQFLKCDEALVTYNLDGGQSGSFTVNKIAPDNNATCAMLANQHKVPVP